MPRLHGTKERQAWSLVVRTNRDIPALHTDNSIALMQWSARWIEPRSAPHDAQVELNIGDKPQATEAASFLVACQDRAASTGALDLMAIQHQVTRLQQYVTLVTTELASGNHEFKHLKDFQADEVGASADSLALMLRSYGCFPKPIIVPVRQCAFIRCAHDLEITLRGFATRDVC